MARSASQWGDDDPSRGEQAATPHPISVYTKLNDCQVSLQNRFAGADAWTD